MLPIAATTAKGCNSNFIKIIKLKLGVFDQNLVRRVELCNVMFSNSRAN